MSEPLLLPSDTVASPPKSQKGWRELPEKAGRPLSQEVPPRPLNAVTLLKALRTNWKRACGWGLLAAAVLAAFVWVALPSMKPSAYTKLRLLPPDQSETYIRSPEAQIEQRTHKELILSTAVLGKAYDRPGIADLETMQEKGSRENAIRTMKNDVMVDFPSGSEIIRIRYEGEHDQEIGKIVTAVENSYIAELTGRASANREARYLEIKGQRIEAEKRLKKLNEVQSLKSDGSAGGNSDRMEAQSEWLGLTSEISRLDREASSFKSTISVLEGRLAQGEKATVSELDLASRLSTDEAYVENSRQLRLLNLQFEDYKKRYEANSPALARAQREIAEVQKRLDERRGEISKSMQIQAQDKFEKDLKDSLQTKKAEYKGVLDQSAALQLRREALRPRMGGGRLTFDGKDIDVDQAKEDVSTLRRKETQAELEMHAKQGIEELEPATVEIPNDRARRMKVSAMAGIAGFGAVLMLFAFIEFRARRVSGIDDVIMDMGMRLVGSVPRCPSNALVERGLPMNPSAQDLHWNTLLAESIDSARTILMHAARSADMKVILISSAVSGEGKSTVSRALAQSLARSGRKTLLIDGDLRKPTLHAHFGMPMTPGVCEALRGESSPDQLLRATPVANLTIIPAGRVERLSIQQLAQDGLGRLIAELRDQFDFILVDSSPILPVADGMLMARHADGVLFSLFVNASQIERVNSAHQRLAQLEVPVIGAIVNGTREEVYGYGSAKYYTGIKG